LERNWKKWNAGQVVPWTISLAFENSLSITLSLYPCFFKSWRKSPSLCLVVSTVEHIRFTLMSFIF
jgi:hypothetical protein